MTTIVFWDGSEGVEAAGRMSTQDGDRSTERTIRPDASAQKRTTKAHDAALAQSQRLSPKPHMHQIQRRNRASY